MSKSKWFVVALSGLLAITLVVSAGVFAQGPRNGGAAPNARFQDEDGDGVCDLCGQEPVGRGGWAGMGGWMMGGRWGGQFSLVDAVVDVTGADRTEVIAALQGGDSLEEFLAGYNATTEAVVDAVLATRKESPDTAVAEGRITRDQADLMLEHMEEEIGEHLEGEWDMPCLSGQVGPRAGARGGGRGFGRMGATMGGRAF